MLGVNEIISVIVSLFDGAYTGLDKAIPSEFNRFIYARHDQAVRTLLHNRGDLDRLVRQLFDDRRESVRLRTVSGLSPEKRFCLLDRLLFSFHILRTLSKHNDRKGRSPMYSHPGLLIVLCTERYRADVIVPCLTSNKPPFFSWKGPD